MFDPIEIEMAAMQAANELAQNGQIGYTEGETIHPIDPKFLPNFVVNATQLGITTDVFFSGENLTIPYSLYQIAENAKRYFMPIHLVFENEGNHAEGVITFFYTYTLDYGLLPMYFECYRSGLNAGCSFWKNSDGNYMVRAWAEGVQ